MRTQGDQGVLLPEPLDDPRRDPLLRDRCREQPDGRHTRDGVRASPGEGRPPLHPEGSIWQIEKIANDRKIYVTSVEDPLAAVPGWDGEMLPIPFGLAQKTGRAEKEGGPALSENSPEASAELLARSSPIAIEGTRMVVDEIHEHMSLGAPLPSDDLILLEGWQKYLDNPHVLRREAQQDAGVHVRGGPLEKGADPALVPRRVPYHDRADGRLAGAGPEGAGRSSSSAWRQTSSRGRTPWPPRGTFLSPRG